MININQADILNNGASLFIDINLSDLSYFTNMTINNIYVYNNYTFNSSSLINKNYYYTKSYSLAKTISLNVVESELTINSSADSELKSSNPSIDLENELIFVVIKCSGTPSSDTPCGMDNTTIVIPVYNKKIITSLVLNNVIHKTDGCCESNQKDNTINTLLAIKSIEYALKAEDYDLAIELWEEYILKTRIVEDCDCESSNSTTKSSGCGCNK